MLQPLVQNWADETLKHGKRPANRCALCCAYTQHLTHHHKTPTVPTNTDRPAPRVHAWAAAKGCSWRVADPPPLRFFSGTATHQTAAYQLVTSAWWLRGQFGCRSAKDQSRNKDQKKHMLIRGFR